MDNKLSTSVRYSPTYEDNSYVTLLTVDSYDILQEISNIQAGFLLCESYEEMYIFFDCMLTLLMKATGSKCGFIGEVVVNTKNKMQSVKTLAHSETFSANQYKKTSINNNDYQGIEFGYDHPIVTAVLTDNQPVIFDSGLSDSHLRELKTLYPELVKLIVIPFSANNRLIGVCCLGNNKDGYNDNLLKALTPLITCCSTVTLHYRLKKERHHQERMLIEHEAILKQTQKIAQISNWRWNVTDDVFTLNDYYFEIFGIVGDESDTSIRSVFKYIHDDDRDKIQLLVRNIHKLPEEVSSEFRIISDDNEIKYVKIIGYRQYDNEESDKVIYIGSIQEITKDKLREEEIKNSEQKLSSLFSALPDLFIIFNKEGRYLEIAQCNEQLLILPREQLIGKTLKEVFNKEKSDFFQGLIEKCLSENKTINADYCLTINNKVTWFNSVCVPYRNEQVVFISRDVHERKINQLIIEGINSILEYITTGKDISFILESIALLVESVIPDMTSSVLVYDSKQHYLKTASAPNLPAELSMLINGLKVEEGNGACGTAAYRLQPVIVYDCLDDPLMERFRFIAQQFSLRSIWSNPILGKSNTLLGTFALYGKSPSTPSPTESELLSKISRLASIAIERDLEEKTRTENERRYKNISELISDYAYSLVRTVDGSYSIEWLAGNYENIFGYAITELEEHINNLSFIHTDDIPRMMKRRENLFSGKDDESEFRVFTKSGDIKWVKDYIKPEWDSELKVPIRIVGAAKDITESIHQNDNLRLQATMLNSVAQAVIATDKIGHIIYANNFTETLYGWKPEEILGKNIIDVTPSETSYREAVEIFKELSEGKSWSGELETKHKNGTTLSTYVTDSPFFDDNGQLIGIVGVSQDISAKKNAILEQQRTLERVKLQNEILAIVASSEHVAEGNLLELCSVVTQKVGNLFDIERTSVWLFNQDNSELQCIYQFEKRGNKITSGTTLTESEFKEEFHYLKTLKFVDINDPLNDPRVAGYVESYIKPNNISALLDAIVRIGGRNLGTLCFEHVGIQHVWTPDEISFCNQLADQIGACILNAEKKTALKILKESEERFSSTFKYAPIGLAIIDTSGRIVKVNAALCGILGYTQDELEKLTITEITHPEDIEIDIEFTKKLQEGIRETYRIEKRFSNKDKETIWVQLSVSALRDVNGVVEFVIVQVQDITEQRRIHNQIAEEKEWLSVTLQSIGDGVITTDKNGVITFINHIAENITQWKNSEAVGKSLLNVFKIANQLTIVSQSNLVETIVKKGKVFDLDSSAILVTKHGKEVSISDSAAPIKDNDDNIIGVIITFRDITKEQKLTEIALKNSKLDSLAVLAGGIAHDFNNLLAGIFGYLEVAKIYLSKGTYSKVESSIGSAVSVFDRARALTQQLITFAKGGDPVRSIGSIEQLLTKTLKFVFSGSAISYSLEIVPDLYHCDFDENQIGQVVDNIAINAIQAMPNGGNFYVRAYNREVTTESNEGKEVCKNYVCIEFHDNGKGIPSHIIPRIFDPFFTTKNTGHGLGLSTVHSIVQKHGGWIDVESVENYGTTFFVYIPAVNSSSKDIQQIEGKGFTAQTSVKKILVMDDEDFIRDILKEILEELGYSVSTTTHGEEALSQYREALEINAPFDVILLDLTIPGGKGGKEVAYEIRKNDWNTKLVAFSGYSEDPVITTPEKYGFNGRLIKPFTHKQLETLLKRGIQVL